MAQQFTPWQKMKAYEEAVRKIEDNWRIVLRKKGAACEEPEEGVILAEVCEEECKRPLTYYNNGKCNYCCKQLYDYNYFYCEGYDQNRHREDRKHAMPYMQHCLEEEYPCRLVTLTTNWNYGHRCPIDPMRAPCRVHEIDTFYRKRGAGYCINANNYNSTYGATINNGLRLNPTTAFRWNSQFGYTYSPARN